MTVAPFRGEAFHELLRCEVAQRLMGPAGVVAAFPGKQGRRSGGHLQISGVAFRELLGVGTVGALETPVELGAARRQHEELNGALRASGERERDQGTGAKDAVLRRPSLSGRRQHIQRAQGVQDILVPLTNVV